MTHRVVVTGAGCISGVGERVDDLSAALLEGRTAIRHVDRFDVSECRSRRAAMLTSFDAAKYIDAGKLRRIDEVGRLAIASSRLALEHAGNPVVSGALTPDRVGVVFGSFTAGTSSTVSYVTNLVQQGAAGVSAMTFSNTVGNAAASLSALEFGLRGPNVTLSLKEASGLGAAVYAADLVRHGRANAVVAGGVDWLDEYFFRVHDSFGVLAHAEGGLPEASRPFDRRRNGFVLGEGAYAVVLESEASARSRGAAVLGHLRGSGSTGARVPINAWPTEPSQLARAMRLALEDASMSPHEVGVVFASANSTALDRVEAAAIEQVFGRCRVPVVSLKGALGEGGASGSAGLVAALACLSRDELPPTAGLEELDEACPVDASPERRPARGRIAMINAFASGGTNYVLIVECGAVMISRAGAAVESTA